MSSRRSSSRPSPDAAREHELVMHLESDQLVAETRQPVPRARLGRRAAAGLWMLRVFVIVLSAMVLYAFVEALT